MHRLALFLLAFTSGFALLAACGSESETPDASAGEATPSPTTAARPAADFPTDDPRIPALVVGAILDRDTIEMAGLTGYQQVACSREESDDLPVCRAEEDEGELVEVLPFTPRCSDQRQWVRPEDVPPTYGLLVDVPELVTIYEPTDKIDHYGTDVVVLVESGTHDDGLAAGYAFHVDGGRIVWMEGECNSIVRLLDNDRITSYVVDIGWADESD